MFEECIRFFFSSRRRHTICGRDWSSDVCSSDLGDVLSELCRAGPGSGYSTESRGRLMTDNIQAPVITLDGPGGRSEERRVGKEWRCEWCTYDRTDKTLRIVQNIS